MRPTAAEEARTLVAEGRVAMLATLTADGGPWASLIVYATLPDGTPVLSVSELAEHGRNLQRDPRASLAIAATGGDGDPLATGRVTLAGAVEVAGDDEIGDAYHGFADFTRYVLRIERIRWVGGYARMDSPSVADYRAAEPDPVAPAAAGAVRHLNADHADALLDMARALGGHPEAAAARCERADRYGLDLAVTGPDGRAWARVDFAAPVSAPDGLRAATVELARRARAT